MLYIVDIRIESGYLTIFYQTRRTINLNHKKKLIN